MPHHITQRGNRRQQVFFNDADYAAYFELLAEWCGEHGVEIWSYCLMPNHMHLIATPSSENGLRWAIGQTHQRYTRGINFREKWRGYLWQGRFASFVMDEPYLLAAARYIELDPVRARLVSLAGDGGLVGGLAGLDESLPLDGLAEQLDHAGRPGGVERLPVQDPRRNGVDDPVGGHPACQGADVAVFERALGPEGDFDCLFAVGGHRRAVRAVHGDVDDAEPDLRFGPSSAASNVTFGELLELLRIQPTRQFTPVFRTAGPRAFCFNRFFCKTLRPSGTAAGSLSFERERPGFDASPARLPSRRDRPASNSLTLR